MNRRTGTGITVMKMLAVAAAMTAKGAEDGLPWTIITNVTASQRSDPSMIVDVTYDMTDPSNQPKRVFVDVSTNAGATYDVTPVVINYAATGVSQQATFMAYQYYPEVFTTQARVRVRASVDRDYVVVDISGGPGASSYPVSYGLVGSITDTVYKTSKLLLRRIPAGSFLMGSPTNELGRYGDETPHMVWLTNDYYIGVYEITQAQYSNVMGRNPAQYVGLLRPVERVSWMTVRGGTWPGGLPVSTSFCGRLSSKTGWLFDLPTEAEWEYACRAETTTSLNNGTNITNAYGKDGNLDLLGRYSGNGGNTQYHAVVGAYLTNKWGLYDMHGNVYEFVLDWGGSALPSQPQTNPVGIASSPYGRVVRGGDFTGPPRDCRSANRYDVWPWNESVANGFRVKALAGP